MISQKFFFMECDALHPVATVRESNHSRIAWTTGLSLNAEVKEPLSYEMDLSDFEEADEEELENLDLANYAADDFNIGAMINSLHQSLIRHDLLQLLQNEGVDNLEVFNAIITNPISKTCHYNYSSFNIVGLADFDWARDLRLPIYQRQFRVKSPPMLMFYLYDDGPIVVYDSIRKAVMASEIEGMVFTPTYERY